MKLTQTVTWIPVEERLPWHSDFVHVALPDGSIAQDKIKYGMWEEFDGFHNTQNPTHWAEPLKHPSELQGEGK